MYRFSSDGLAHDQLRQRHLSREECVVDIVIESIRLRTMMTGLLTALFLVAFSPLAAAQRNGIPHVIQMESGLEFDGEHVPILKIGEKLADVVPFDQMRPSNILLIDEGLRQVFVNQGRVRNTAESNRVESEFDVWQMVHPTKARGAGTLISSTPFNDLGHRILTTRVAGHVHQYVQGITKITPRYVVVDTLRGNSSPNRSFEMSIGLNNVSPNVLHAILRSQITDPDQPQEHLAIVDFFVQAGEFGKASDELRLLKQKFPAMADQFEGDRSYLRQQEAAQVMRELRKQVSAGQVVLAKQWATEFNREGVAGQTLAELQDIIDGIEADEDKVTTAKDRIMELIAIVEADAALQLDSEQKSAINRFKAELETELSVSNVSRLDSFLVQANDPAQSELEKLSLAISGWLRGSNNADTNFSVTQGMYQVRDLILLFMRTDEAVDRARILNEIAKFESGAPDSVADLLVQMKPLEHEQTVKGYTGEKPIELIVTLDGTKARPEPLEFKALVHLPAEYDPYRRYPLMISLTGKQSVDTQINFFTGKYIPNLKTRWGHASREGVIVMALEWKVPGQFNCRYSAREHATVMKALRMALEKFAVDTDKVFLQGYGAGGAGLAYDIGLAHPEHWAGVIGISGQIQRYAKIHALDQGIPLAIYSVVGEKDYESMRACQDSWNRWLVSQRYHDCTLSMYDGRLNEMFFDDIPNMFNWMRAQKRRLPDRNGFEFKVKSLRPWDNYYWFYELHGFPLKNVSWPEDWKDRGHSPLAIECSIRPQQPAQPDLPMRFNISPKSAGAGATLWLAPEYYDFDGTIEIGTRGFKGSVKPSTSTILNDVRRRGDRQHPFWARVDEQGGRWSTSQN